MEALIFRIVWRKREFSSPASLFFSLFDSPFLSVMILRLVKKPSSLLDINRFMKFFTSLTLFSCRYRIRRLLANHNFLHVPCSRVAPNWRCKLFRPCASVDTNTFLPISFSYHAQSCHQSHGLYVKHEDPDQCRFMAGVRGRMAIISHEWEPCERQHQGRCMFLSRLQPRIMVPRIKQLMPCTCSSKETRFLHPA